MRYKVGDKVVIKQGFKFNGNDYSNKATVIIAIRNYNTNFCLDDYEVGIHDNLCLYDRDIDHEATAKLNEVKPITLLETGMVVEFENKEVMMVLEGDFKTHWYGEQKICFINTEDFMVLNYYSEDLIYNKNSRYNINKIYKNKIGGLVDTLKFNHDSELIWERPQLKPKIITYTTQELMEKLGLYGDTKIEIVDK